MKKFEHRCTFQGVNFASTKILDAIISVLDFMNKSLKDCHE